MKSTDVSFTFYLDFICPYCKTEDLELDLKPEELSNLLLDQWDDVKVCKCPECGEEFKINEIIY